MKFPNLLPTESRISLFWKSVIERLVIGEAPFATAIINDQWLIGSSTVDLSRARWMDVIITGTKEWRLQPPIKDWREIRKQSVKNILLYNFAQKQTHLTARERIVFLVWLHLMLNLKQITNDHIKMHMDRFEIESIARSEFSL